VLAPIADGADRLSLAQANDGDDKHLTSMRVFVYEHISGGGLCGQPLPAGLLEGGDGMLRSLVTDLCAAEVQVRTTRDSRLASLGGCAHIAWVKRAGAWRSAWENGLGWCDAAWPIAPESDNLLTRLSEEIVAAGRTLLGSRPDAVALASSKLASVRTLSDSGVPVIETWPAYAVPEDLASPWVVKPNDGAGCEKTHLLTGEDSLDRWMQGVPRPQDYVVQPFVPGVPASLSLLCDGSQAQILSCNRQRVSLQEGRFCFRGVEVDGFAEHARTWRPLARAIQEAIRGLWGYVGVDLIHTPSGPWVLELNPRLTLSYCALPRRRIGNPATRVLGFLASDSRKSETDGRRAS
jgi:predicted ATP-grasp superfamily ATP-dependent carboligase